MSIEERAAVAAELKATGKCNCTQSVVNVFEDKRFINVLEISLCHIIFLSSFSVL